MKILLIHNYHQYRGGEDVCFDSLVTLLKSRKHDVLVFTKKSEDINRGISSKLDASIGMFLNRRVSDDLTNIINSFKPDIAHISNIFPLITPVAYQVCHRFNIPIVQSIYSFKMICPKVTLFRNGKVCELCIKKRNLYPSILYGCYHHSRIASAFLAASFLFHDIYKQLNIINKIIFPAEYSRDYFRKTLNIPLHKTLVIPIFVDIDTNFKTITQKKLFVFVGRLSEEKGIIRLLNIFSDQLDLKLIVIGDGPLKKEVDKYKKYKNIEIKGYIPKKEVYNYYKMALCTIIPSVPLYEFGPLVLIESFAQGTPVLVPNSGVFKERVINNKTGVFYNPDDDNDLAAKIEEISKYTTSMIQRMTINIKKEYRSKYTSSTHYKLLLKTYREVI